MISFDTNILFHSLNRNSPVYGKARSFLSTLPSTPQSVAVSDLILVELYVLLRNPAVIEKPLGPRDAVELISSFRQHPTWQLLSDFGGHTQIMAQVWDAAKSPQFARRAIFDARIAFTLLSAGVTEFATCNVTHFSPFAFSRVWNPLETRQS